MSETTTTRKAVRTADLTAAQRKVLVAVFGDIPEATFVVLEGRKGSQKTQTACECGCGENANSLFIIGHDAKMKSVLNSVLKGEDVRSPNYHQFTKATAAAELAKRGW